MIDDQGRILTNVNSTYRPPTGIGIHPRKAAEHHNAVSSGVIEKALQGVEDGISPDAVCYSAGPGLGPCLRIGATISRALALYLAKPLVPLPYTIKGNDVAYSGLLTAANRLLKQGHSIADICFSVQEVSFSMLAEAVERSLVQTRKNEVLLAGGVAMNKRLRDMIKSVAED